MREYFNKLNRENHMLMLLLWDKVDIWISQTTQLNKAELKALRIARAWLSNANNAIIARLGKEYYSKLVRDVDNSKFEILTAYSASGKKASVKVLTEDIDLLSRYATTSCQSININCNGYWNKCEVFQTLNRLNAEPLHTHTDFCPYKQIESEDLK